MESIDFLAAVLPAQGKYCAFTMRDKLRKNIFVDSLENLYETNLNLSERGQNTFYALSAFDDEGTREATHAQCIRALFMDLDCGEGKAFPTKKAAVEALYAFLQASGLSALGVPWLVDSGGGVHVYWPFEAEVDIAAWQPLAEALKRAARQHALPIDMTVTADAARVLRMPGTLNWKYAPPRPVTLRTRGGVFRVEALRNALQGYVAAPPMKPPGSALALPGSRPSMELSPTAKALAGNTATYFKNIMIRTVNGTGCGQLQYYVDHATEDGMEPLWRGLLSWAKVCDDGAVAARKLSALHPYDEERMARKLAEIRGPYPCVKMDSENPGICPGCPHWGKITNPLVLGREILTSAAPAQIEVPQPEGSEEPPIHMHRPEPPFGFEYGRRGGVFYIKPADKDDEAPTKVCLTPYDFFMTRMFRDGPDYQAEFMVIKGSKVITFAVPTSDITAQKDCLKVLSKNNVMANTPGADPYLYQYVRQSMQRASATGEETVVPPRLGWQDDNSFAVYDTVYSQHSAEHNYNYVSNRLHNLISATQPSGALDSWKQVFTMMRQKAVREPALWGHLAMAGAGFGSILMRFTPHGSRAAVLHLCSKDSGAGKTLAVAMAVSVWGDPARYLVAPSTSERTMMQRAGMLGSLPLCIDEITANNRELNREWLPKFIFDYAAGMHKIKGSASSNAEVQHEMLWSGIAMLTSNTPGLEAMMGARKHTSEGEVRRYLEWNLPDRYKLVWTPEEKRALSLLAGNVGHAGPAFAQWCVRHQDQVQQVIDQVRGYWLEKTGATDDERFWTATVTSICAGYILAGRKHANIIDMPVSPIFAFFEELIARQRKVIAGNQASALDTLNAYTAEHYGSFIKTEGSTVLQHLAGGAAILPSSAKSQVRGRVEYNVTPGYVNFFIDVRHMKLHCADHSVGFDAFVKELQTSCTVEIVQKNLLAGTKGPQMRTKCLKIVRSIEDVEADS